MWVKSASMEKSARVRKFYTGLVVEEEVRLLDDCPRVRGTVLQLVLERYDVPRRLISANH